MDDLHDLRMLLIRKSEALANVETYFRWLGRREDQIGAEARLWADWAAREASADHATNIGEWPT